MVALSLFEFGINQIIATHILDIERWRSKLAHVYITGHSLILGSSVGRFFWPRNVEACCLISVTPHFSNDCWGYFKLMLPKESEDTI